MSQTSVSLFVAEPAPKTAPPKTRRLDTTLGEVVIVERPPQERPPTSKDAALIAILDAPLALGETAAQGFARKELELAAAMAELSVIEAFHLRARLQCPQPDDALAAKFARLTVDRRGRLVRFLGDARRREALARGGK